MTVKTKEHPTSIQDLKPKMALKGVVKKVELFGAFVDIGIGSDAVLHISQLSSEHVRNVSDMVQEGDEIDAWVYDVDQEKERVFLTMIRPPDVGWGDLKVGQSFTGTVIRLDRFAAFVDIGAEREGRIHVSELADNYVKAPEDVVQVGDEVQVTVLNANRRKGQIELSMKGADRRSATVQKEDQNDGPALTAMEIAFRRAMEGTEFGDELTRRRARKKKRRRGGRRYQEQADILARTLQQREK